MKAFFISIVLVFVLTACASKPERHYQLSGTVIALNPKAQTATINGAAIPNFMEAMTMEYPVKSKTEFNALHAGDRIKATVNVRDDEYNLSNIEKQK